ncbi:hypothetical protein [Catellatospora tritici]|uniref:hypothetical protein n=1 Tax=Catellatospora tritici TaxID=2851566 RepID=UPI001C2DBA51|nr:hypothetical protein [Catellatospora tritici]MBV1850040.1 hypothetical protein [Catellatospora tritici]
MSPYDITRVDEAVLVHHDELGVGGQAKVSLVHAPGFDQPMAYKAYNQQSLSQLDADALEQLIDLPGSAEPGLREVLTTRTAWPKAVVQRAGQVCGFLMPVAPAGYTAYLRLPDGMKPQLLALEFLLNPVEYMANVNLPVTERQRLELLAELARLLHLLHSAGVAVGDLSPKNVLVRLTPPSCHLLDADAMRVRGRSALPQVETPDWSVPSGEELGTVATDSYKFALVVLRILLSDQYAGDPAALRPRHPELALLAEQALSRSTSDRPGPGQWLGAIERALPNASVQIPTVPVAPRPVPGPATPAQVPPGGLVIPARPPTRTSRSGVRFLVGAGLAAVVALALCVGCFNLLGRNNDNFDATGTEQAVASYAADDPGGGDPGTGGGGADDGAEQAAAVQAILTPSKVDRNNLTHAVANISGCDNLAANIAALQRVGNGRRAELAQAQALRVSDLPGGEELAATLVTALTHSLAADQAFVKWGRTRLNSGCTKANKEGGQYDVGMDESTLATAAKQRFVELWNPIAAQYGHPVIEYTDM